MYEEVFVVFERQRDTALTPQMLGSQEFNPGLPYGVAHWQEAGTGRTRNLNPGTLMWDTGVLTYAKRT